MEHTRSLTLLIGLFISVSAQSNSIDHCLKITNSSDRLSCYDQAFGYKSEVGAEVISTAVIENIVEKAATPPIEKPVAKKNHGQRSTKSLRFSYCQFANNESGKGHLHQK